MKKLLLFLLLAIPCFAQKQIFQPTPPTLAADPATCSTTGAWFQKFYYNSVSNVWKQCTATNTWGALGGGSVNPTSGVMPVNSGGALIDSPASVSGGVVTFTGGVVATSFTTAASSVAQSVQLKQGTLPSFNANSFALYAPTGITTSFGWSLPTAENAAAGLLRVGAASSHASALTVSTDAILNACTMVIGSDDGPLLVDLDLGPQTQQCNFPWAVTIVEIDVMADLTGVPQTIVAKKAGNGTTVTNLLSAALPTSGTTGNNYACASTNAACYNGAAKSGSVTIVTAASANVLAAGDTIGLVSGTAGGVSHRMTISVIYTRNN